MGQPKLSITTSVISSLPEIVKKEVLFPSVKDKDVGAEERFKIARRLITAFQIQFPKNEGYDEADEHKISPMEVAVGEFCAYLRVFPYHITGEEILEAYRMASRGELRDFAGNLIELYPNLKTPQAGKILMAYMEFKAGNAEHTKHINRLKLMANPQQEIPKEVSKEIKKKNWENLVASVKQGEPCDYAFTFFDVAVKKGAFGEFLGNKELQVKTVREKMQQILAQEKRKIQPSHFNKKEIEHLTAYFADENGTLAETATHAFQKLDGMATTLVKNDLVYEWVKEQIKNRQGDEQI